MLLREMKAMLGAPIQNVFGRLRPFMGAKIGCFRFIKRAAEMLAQTLSNCWRH